MFKLILIAIFIAFIAYGFVAVLTVEPSEPYTLIVENAQTNEEVMRFKDVVWHRYSSGYRQLTVRLAGTKMFEEQTITLKNRIYKFIKVVQKRRYE